MTDDRQEATREAVDVTRLAWRSEVVLIAAQHLIAADAGREPPGRPLFKTSRSIERSSNLDVARSILVASGLFDPSYYITENSDVAKSGLEPVDHYLLHGGIEGRRPGPLFDGSLYLASYGDVKSAGMNPILHYIVYGIPEGRSAGTPTVLPKLADNFHANDVDALKTNLKSHTHGKSSGLIESLGSSLDLLTLALTSYREVSELLSTSIASVREDVVNRESVSRAANQELLIRIDELQRQMSDLQLQKSETQALLYRAVAQNDELLCQMQDFRVDADNRVATIRTEYEAQSRRRGEADTRLRQALQILNAKITKVGTPAPEDEAIRTADSCDKMENHFEQSPEEFLELISKIETDIESKLSFQIPEQAIDALRESQHVQIGQVDNTDFKLRLLQKFAYKFLLAMRASQARNMDRRYTPYSALMNSTSKKQRLITFSAFVVANWDRFARSYLLLADDRSKSLFIDLLLFRALGHEHVRLPSNTEEFWEHRRWTSKLDAYPSECASAEGGSGINRYSFNFNDQSIDLECFENNIFFSFGVEQYYFEREGISITPSAGDFVVDAGTCLGDTAVRMAMSVGDSGRIYTFDPVPVHRSIAERNINRNGIENVVIFPYGLSNRQQAGSGPTDVINPGFNIAGEADHLPLETIDGLVANQTLKQVDFIKMDIEGSELAALQGATATIKAFRPKLAISVYHKWEDYYTIIEFIDSLSLGYKFYLDNYTLSDDETVLYCTAR